MPVRDEQSPRGDPSESEMQFASFLLYSVVGMISVDNGEMNKITLTSMYKHMVMVNESGCLDHMQ